jgi:serine/threonine-protein kinase
MIGPYRILAELGAGGMGEVFLAHDERLDRRVAIKRIRPEAGGRTTARERFRREARLAARLSHPAIVQVYDILQENDSDSIVMEYVEGRNLRQMIEHGPLPVRRALELARELADGLDAAHRQGIVHRDLKTENVLVTPEGRPKIADFGIAKRLANVGDGADGAEGNDADSLTRDHGVVGTWRAMAPEQARGEEVDARTDLFAFGVLLYEMLTGRSPFTAENGLATLHRVMHARQTPVREINPAVPEAVSRLVDQLLDKEPALRPQSAGQVRRELDRLALSTADFDGTVGTMGTMDALAETVAERVQPPIPPAGSARPFAETSASSATGHRLVRRPAVWLLALLAVAGLGAWGYRSLHHPSPPLYVAVLAPQRGAGTAAGETELLASGVRVALLQGLVSLEGVSPLSFEEIDAASGSPRQVARAVAADELVTARLDCRPELCRISLNRLRGADGRVLWAGSVEVATGDFAAVAGAVTRMLQGGYAGRRLREGAAALDVRGPDLEEFLRLRRELGAPLAVQEPLLQKLAAVRQSSPRFLDAYLLEAEADRFRFFHSRDTADLDQAFRMVAAARELAPADPRPLLILTDLALARGDLKLATATLTHLEELLPGDVRLLDRRSRILEAQGLTREALGLKRTAARIEPSADRLFNLAQAEYQMGDLAAARATLGQVLERSPEHRSGLFLQALLELSNGDLDRAISIYSDLVQRSPNAAALANLGLAYFLAGRYDEAATVYRLVLAKDPKNPGFHLNLADTDLLAGRRTDAEKGYRRVIELADADPGPSAQTLSIKAQAFAHLGQGPAAVAALQQALRLAADQGAVAYEAAVVYALLGEESSALVNAEKAVHSGLGPRWFSLPWFAALRSDPSFQEILKSPRSAARK